MKDCGPSPSGGKHRDCASGGARSRRSRHIAGVVPLQAAREEAVHVRDGFKEDRPLWAFGVYVLCWPTAGFRLNAPFFGCVTASFQISEVDYPQIDCTRARRAFQILILENIETLDAEKVV